MRINDRRILESLSKTAGLDNFVEFPIIIDKLDKIGLDEVIKLLKDKGSFLNNFKDGILPKELLSDQFAPLKSDIQTLYPIAANSNNKVLFNPIKTTCDLFLGSLSAMS